MKINPQFYEDSLQLRVYNIESVKTLTREQNKQTIHLFLNVQNRQNEIVINM